MAKRILVADDSVTIQRAFAMVFAGQNVSLIAARSWDEALASARQHRPDLVIADVHLGDRSGYDLCAAVKGDHTLAGIPVYILASNQVPFDAARGSHARADGHLLKPFDSTKLLETVDRALGERTPAPIAAAPSTSVPIAVSEENTSKVQVQDVAFEDEDSYGEFSIEPTANSGAPPMQRTPPPQVQAPVGGRLATPLASRPMPVTPPPVSVSPPARPPLPVAPAPRPMAPAVSAPQLRPAAAPAARPAATAAPIVAAPAPAAPNANAAPTARSMPRPSLIPGVMPPRTSSDGPIPVPRAPATAAPAPVDFGRTMMGLPAMAGPLSASVPVPQARSEVITARETPAVRGLGPSLFEDLPPVRSSAGPAPMAPVAEPLTPTGGRFAEMVANARSSDKLSSRASDALTEKMAEISARGPEYEAIAKLSREIIEQVVWEVVPELAEVMIREQIDRLAKR